MEGLRGLAVFLVFLVHFVGLVRPWLSENSHVFVLAKSLHIVGNAGVDLFFVLSGFLIYGSLIYRRQQFVRFMSRRIERIYPSFVAVFAIYLLLSYVFPAENKIPAPATKGMIYIVANFLLLPGLLPIEPMIAVAWSLSYEMFYYLAIPLVIAVFRLRDRSATWRTAFFLVVALVTISCWAVLGRYTQLVMFISGILLYEALHSPRVKPQSSLSGLLALVVGLLSTLLPVHGPGWSVLKLCILGVAFFVLCLACFQSPTGWLPRSFCWTPLRWFGNMSYSYYLLHGLSLKAAFFALPIVLRTGSHGSYLFWVLLPPMFALTLIPTAALFLLVERPFSLAPRARKSSAPGLAVENAPNNAVALASAQVALGSMPERG